MHFRLKVANQNKKNRIRTLYVLKLLYTGCSTNEAITLLLWQSTWNFEKSCLLQMPFGIIVGNQILKTRIKRQYILKLLHTGCSTKETIGMLPSWSTWNFSNKKLFDIHHGWIVQNQNKTTRIYIFWKYYIHFQNATYRALQERSNDTASFAEHLKLQEKLTCADALWINCSQLKQTKLESGHYTFWNCYIQGDPRKNQ